jgi:hypothetical protein
MFSFFHPHTAAGGIAVDGQGSAYVAGTLNSNNPNSATRIFGAAGSAQAVAFKVSPDGSKESYETTLGGSVQVGSAEFQQSVQKSRPHLAIPNLNE